MATTKQRFSIALLALVFCLSGGLYAQMVGTSAYIKGTSVEIGIDGAGGFEGANTGVSAPLAGMHFRSNTAFFGFVANPQLNGWAGSAWDGDFFTPGTPENGWGIEVGTAGTTYSNNCNASQQIPGSITSWLHTFNCYTSDWQGDINNLHIKVNYFLQETDLYYTTTVSITNNTGASIPDMYYYRNLDPDNNIMPGGGYTTQNTIENQPAGSCGIAQVSATQTSPWNSYFGMAAIGTNWRASYGGFANRDASDLWTGTGFTQTIGSTVFMDEAVALAYRIQNLAPGATETFKFVVILSAAQAGNAVNNLLYLSYPGSASAPPPMCTPYSDTVRICAGVPTTIAIQGSIVNEYNWSWSPSVGLSTTVGPSTNASPLTTTTYTLTGTPLSACVTPYTSTFVVQTTPGVTANPVANITTCAGATVPASAYTSSPAGATYTWTNSNTSIGLAASGTGNTPAFTATNATGSPITSTITVTPSVPSGCTGVPITYTITVNPGLTIGVNSPTICPSATAVLTATGGTTYLWNTGSTANPLSVSPAVTTTYTVTGTTSGCTGTAVATVTVGGSIAPTVNSATICSGSSATLTATAGTSYTWNTGSTTNPLVVSPTTTTSYTVTANSGGCTGTAVATVTVNPIPTATVPANITVCNGAAIAPATFGSTPAGGTFTWTNSDPSIGLAASGTGSVAGFTAVNTGTAPVTATIAVTPTVAGCTGPAATYTITVNPTPSVTVPANATVCNGVAIPATTFSSAVSGATYTWTNSNTAIGLGASGLGDIATFNGTNATTAPLTATITVTPTAATCAGPASTYTITVNPTAVVTVPANITVCNGASIVASAFTSTTAGATFDWSNSDPSIGLAANGTGNTPAFTALNSGTAVVTATITVTPTANGCIGTPSTYTITINPTPAAPTAPGTSTCLNTAATVTATAPGGTYEWFDAPAAGTLLQTGASYTTPSISVATNYYVQTTSAAGCVSPMTTVPVTIAPGLSVNAGADDTICFGASTVLGVTPNGAGYTYSWAPGTGLSSTTVFNPTANPTATTTYTVTVTSPSGCVGSDMITVYSNPKITIAKTAFEVTCNGACNGQAIVIPSGGAGGYSYSWTNGDTTASITGLCPGSYTVTVTDAWGCTAVADTSVTEPSLLTVAITAQTPASCYGVCDGTATALASGGTVGAGYAYSWNTVPVQTTATATALCAGTYTCTVTDANGCTSTVTVTVTEPTLVVINPIADDTICNSGSTMIVAVATGGNGIPYSYVWSAAAGLSSTTVANPTANPTATTTYTVNATDVNGCPAAPVSLTIVVNPPLAVVANGAAAICPGASTTINAIASLGNGSGYTYSWSPAAGLNDPSLASPSASPAATTTYTVTANDGCSPSITATVTVTVLPLPSPAFTSDVTSGCAPLCVNFADNSTITSGAVSGWAWNFGDGTTAIGDSVSHCYANAGSYAVTITDTSAAGCVSTVTINNYITVFPDPIAQATAPVSTSIIAPNVPYTDQSIGATQWYWNFNDPFATGSDTSSNLQNPVHTYGDVGTYIADLTVTSANGCTSTTQVTIVIDPEFTFYIPNAFTPNDDGINDEFYGKGDFFTDYEMSIFDRWGNLIFFTDDINNHWKGTANHGKEIAQQDVYVYVIKLKDNKEKKHKYIGSVTLVK